MEVQTSAQQRAASSDTAIPLAPAGELDDAFAMQIGHPTIESALGAANAAEA